METEQGERKKMCNGIYKIKQMSTKSISRKINYFQCIEFIILHRKRETKEAAVLERRHIFKCVCALLYSTQSPGTQVALLCAASLDPIWTIFARFIGLMDSMLPHGSIGTPTTTKRDLEPRKLHTTNIFPSRVGWVRASIMILTGDGEWAMFFPTATRKWYFSVWASHISWCHILFQRTRRHSNIITTYVDDDSPSGSHYCFIATALFTKLLAVYVVTDLFAWRVQTKSIVKSKRKQTINAFDWFQVCLSY